MPFDARSSLAAALVSVKRRAARTPRLPVRRQIIALQDLALAHAQAKETPVAVCAALMRAYVDLHELRMSVEGVGKPKPVEARNAHTAKRKPRASGPVPPPKQEPELPAP